MGIFRRTQRVNLEEYCREYYECMILNPVKGIEVGAAYFDTARNSIAEADEGFSSISSERFSSEMTPLCFELFALAWMHRFVGKHALAQSMVTKRYLKEKGQGDIWDGMEHYNKSVVSATLHWLTDLGAMNKSFWFHAIEEMSQENGESARRMGLEEEDIVKRVNNRLCSESAWKQGIVVDALVYAVFNELGLSEVRKQTVVHLATVIRGVYDGIYKCLKSIKIKHS